MDSSIDLVAPVSSSMSSLRKCPKSIERRTPIYVFLMSAPIASIMQPCSNHEIIKSVGGSTPGINLPCSHSQWLLPPDHRIRQASQIRRWYLSFPHKSTHLSLIPSASQLPLLSCIRPAHFRHSSISFLPPHRPQVRGTTHYLDGAT